MGRSLSQWLTGSRGVNLVSKRGGFRKGVLSNHDPGSGPTQPKETTMCFYTTPHRNDRIDANKIAHLLKGGNFPLAGQRGQTEGTVCASSGTT